MLCAALARSLSLLLQNAVDVALAVQDADDRQRVPLRNVSPTTETITGAGSNGYATLVTITTPQDIITFLDRLRQELLPIVAAK